MKRSTPLLILILLFAVRLSYAQEHTFSAQYFGKTDYDLPSVLVKAVFQDSSGFVWIGTDAGLIRYDGYSFFTYRSQLPNMYVKDIAPLQDGRLLVTTDMGVAVISHAGYVFQVKTLLPGSYEKTDSTLYYPKKAWQDHSGTIWIGENTSIVRFKNGKMERYELGEEYATSSRVRSFRFAETTRGVLLAISENGHMVYYDKAKDRFTVVHLPFKKSVSLSDMVRQPDGSIWMATSVGIYRFRPERNDLLHGWKRIIPIKDVSSITHLRDGVGYIGTWFDGLYQVKKENGMFVFRKLKEYTFNNVNDVDQTPAGNVWVGSDRGAVLLAPNHFSSLLLSPRYRFINSLITGGRDTLYASETYNIYQITWDSSARKPRLTRFPANLQKHRIFSLGFHKGKVYVGTFSGDIYAVPEKHPTQIAAHYKSGSSTIEQIYVDSAGTIWFIRNDSMGIGKISPDTRQIGIYDRGAMDTVITVLRAGPDNTLYAGGVGSGHYLFRYNSRKDRFENVSPKIPANILAHRKLPLTVFDLAFRAKQLYVASNYGLFRFRIGPAGEVTFEDWPVDSHFKSVAIDHLGNLWMGSEKGLYYLSGDKVVQYNGRDGLPSISIAARALYMDHSGRLWAGTSNGIGYSVDPIPAMKRSRTPSVKRLALNDKEIAYPKNGIITLVRGSRLTFRISGLMYPASKLNYVFQLEDQDGKVVEKIEGRDNPLTLKIGDAGEYTLKIESDISGYTWSRPLVLQIRARLPWYLQKWAFASYLVVLCVLIYIIVDYQKVRQERNSQRKELARWNRIIRRTIDVVPHFLYVRDEDGRFILANRPMADLYGTSPEEIVGKRNEDFTGKIGGRYEEALIRDLTHENEEDPVDQDKLIEYKDANGKQTFLQLTQTYFQTGEQNRRAVAGVAIDITNLVNTEKELRKSQERYRFLSESAFEGLAVMEEGYLSDVNTALLRMTGYTRKEVIGKASWDYFPDPMQKAAINRIRGKISGQYESRLNCRDGKVIDVEILARDIVIDGRHLRIAAIRDITDRKEAERKLKEYAGKLEESNHNLEEFAYVVSHDLQEPLRKIQAFGELLTTSLSGRMEGENILFLDRMTNAAARMQQLINDLLSFSRISTKTNPYEPVDLEELIREVCVDLELSIQESGAEVSVESLPVVVADPMQMRQLFQNLIGNALKFRSEGRPPVIAITSCGETPSRNGFSCIRISDNGIGFDPKFAERIFQVFERLHVQKNYQGTGIGLAICKKIVERHGGTIKAESREGFGTTFYIRLPVHQALETERDESNNSQEIDMRPDSRG